MSNYITFDDAYLQTLLNPSQYEAAIYCDGASIIVAGAGSGKTRVLTYKIAYLLQHGFNAASILALTFTNKAAREMKERIAAAVGPEISRWLWMGTFHGIFLRILQQESVAIGYQPNFTIYDSSDSKSLIKSLIKELNLDEKIYTPRSVASRISKAKNGLITPGEYLHLPDMLREDEHRNQPRFAELYALYCSRCRQSNAMDFDDILLLTYLLFKQNDDILGRYQQRFAYILVDEYQDTNIVQHRIVQMLAARHERVCVVGDDAQSIYSFRGANIDNILTFERTYKHCRLFKLEQNYRSSQILVNAANSLIAKNRNQIPKKVFSELSVGEPIKVIGCVSDFEEGFTIASEIAKALENQYTFSDIAILYRTNAQSRILEEALRKRNFSYRIYGGQSFYQRKEIKDALAYMRLVINPNDEESLKRVINYPARGIGATTLQKILTTAHSHHISVLHLIANMEDYPLDINNGTKNKLLKFAETIRTLTDYNLENDAYQTARKILLDSGMMGDVSETTDPENLSRKENLEELLSALHEFCDQKVNAGDNEVQLVNFLTEVSLLTDQDTDTDSSSNKITLMTIHAAKGLEFRMVVVVGLEEELFPSPMCATERELEEERRLFYVAITRAKERCILSYAKSRFKNGQTQYQMPSRFLNDIDEKYLKTPTSFIPKKTTLFSPPEDTSKQRFPSFKSQEDRAFSSSKANFKPLESIAQSTAGHATNLKNLIVGEHVYHGTFGEGVVLEIEGSENNAKARIDFGKNGIRQLLLKYARLEKL